MKPRFHHFFAALTLLWAGCSSSIDQNTQFTTLLTADTYEAELYDTETHSITLDLSDYSKIYWFGFQQTGHRYFDFSSVVIGGKTYKDEELDEIRSEVIDLTKLSSRKITFNIAFNPLTGQPAVDEPHSDYLEVNVNGGIVKVDFNGYVKGVCLECRSGVGGGYVYKLEDSDGDTYGDFQFILCDDQAITSEFKSTAADMPEEVTGLTGDESYNVATINITGTVNKVSGFSTDFNIYYSQKSVNTLVIEPGNDDYDPTIPPFEITVPVEDAAIEKILVEMVEGSQATCELDSSGGFDCTGILVDVLGGAIKTSDLELTTGSISPKSEGCPALGTWTGSGKVGEDGELVLIGVVSINQAQDKLVIDNGQGVEGALGVAVMHLTYDSDIK